ncbi:hypothetical protein DFS34DRAFT_639286 [Phlyctochytrium arcticum]|nr:hypothetical protein DFS34DRAFT_639286 [Phlyctochytrium arcticum]
MVTGYYITRPVGRLRGLCQAGYPGVEGHLRAAVEDVDTALFDAWNLAHVHFQRQAGAFLTACTDEAAEVIVPEGLTLDGCGSSQTYFEHMLRIAVDIPTPGTHRHPVFPSLRTSLDHFLRPAQHANFTWPDDEEEPRAPGPYDQQLYARPAYSHVQHGQLFAIEAKKMKTAFTTYVALNIEDHIKQTIKHWLGKNEDLALNADQKASLQDTAFASSVLFVQLTRARHG